MNKEQLGITPARFRETADSFTKAYLEAALWSSSAEIGKCEDCGKLVIDTEDRDTCPDKECGGRVWGYDRSFQDHQCCIEECSPELLARFMADCEKFQRENGELITDENLKRANEHGLYEMAGHDFWLTRNGHGCGFWDGDWEKEAGEKLTKVAKSYGEVNLYATLNDDGEITVHG